MLDLIGIKEIANNLQPELSKILENLDAKNIDLGELDRPILKQIESTPESDMSESRPLTQEEKIHYGEKLGCSERLLESATIDETEKIHIRTINDAKEGQTGADGVTYERRTVEVHGIEVEGVFPQFDSAINVQLPEHLIQATDAQQAKYANQELKEKVDNDPDFKKQFSSEQLEQIECGETPDDYTWHHNEEPGKMQLISTEDHQQNRHTGGKSIWGGGSVNR